MVMRGKKKKHNPDSMSLPDMLETFKYLLT